MDRDNVRQIQRKLRDMGLYTGPIDGRRGAKTNAAIRQGLPQIPGNMPAGMAAWSAKRQAIGFLQMYCHSEGINAGHIDGWWGPQTDWAADALEQKIETGQVENWRDIVPGTDNPNGWPKQSGVTAFYGPHGRPNFGPTPPPPLVRVPSPWRMKLAWDGHSSRTSFWVHEKVADSLKRVLAKIDAAYTDPQKHEIGIDQFGGDYNARKMRAGSAWSMHSWGIAIDFDPVRNRLRWGRDRARLAKFDCIPFWRAWESEGWVSLGREKNYDWMHVQAAKL